MAFTEYWKSGFMLRVTSQVALQAIYSVHQGGRFSQTMWPEFAQYVIYLYKVETISKILSSITFRPLLSHNFKKIPMWLSPPTESVADPGFPEEGAPTPRGCQHTILPNFPKNCMKLKEFGPPGVGHASLVPPPLDSPLRMAITSRKWNTSTYSIEKSMIIYEDGGFYHNDFVRNRGIWWPAFPVVFPSFSRLDLVIKISERTWYIQHTSETQVKANRQKGMNRIYLNDISKCANEIITNYLILKLSVEWIFGTTQITNKQVYHSYLRIHDLSLRMSFRYSCINVTDHLSLSQ